VFVSYSALTSMCKLIGLSTDMLEDWSLQVLKESQPVFAYASTEKSQPPCVSMCNCVGI